MPCHAWACATIIGALEWFLSSRADHKPTVSMKQMFWSSSMSVGETGLCCPWEISLSMKNYSHGRPFVFFDSDGFTGQTTSACFVSCKVKEWAWHRHNFGLLQHRTSSKQLFPFFDYYPTPSANLQKIFLYSGLLAHSGIGLSIIPSRAMLPRIFYQSCQLCFITLRLASVTLALGGELLTGDIVWFQYGASVSAFCKTFIHPRGFRNLVQAADFHFIGFIRLCSLYYPVQTYWRDKVNRRITKKGRKWHLCLRILINSTMYLVESDTGPVFSAGSSSVARMGSNYGESVVSPEKKIGCACHW